MDVNINLGVGNGGFGEKQLRALCAAIRSSVRSHLHRQIRKITYWPCEGAPSQRFGVEILAIGLKHWKPLSDEKRTFVEDQIATSITSLVPGVTVKITWS